VSEEGVERRLTTILAADVVGYSRLMGDDEAGTLAALKSLRRELVKPKESQYGGRTVKLMGDGALMEFSSVVDAVQFAVEVQVAIAERNADVPEDRRIVYRMGINIGDIIVEGDDIHGDGVNVAARLEGLSEPGGVCIARSVFNQVKGKLDLTFEHLGEKEVKNIVEPVSVYRIDLDDKAAALVTPITVTPPTTGRGRWPQIAAGLVLSLVAVAGLVWWQPWAPDVEPAAVERMAVPLPDRPSIAVLPFANMSDDSSQEFFVDGMTEDLITDLAKIESLFVIARNTVFTYKGKSVVVPNVARELGVRYVLEGSVRRAGDRVRINAQLLDGTSGAHIWAERYDGSLADIFALQDKVTSEIIAELKITLTPDEQERQERKDTDNPQAHDAYLRGWQFYRRYTPEDFVKAIPHFERAVELDPNFGQAWAALASVYWISYRKSYAWTLIVNPNRDNFVSSQGARHKAEQYLEQAKRKPTPLAHQIESQMSWNFRQFDKALNEAERAVALDPNDPDGHLAMAWALIFAGSADAAIASAENGVQLDPYFPGSYLFALGTAQLMLDRYTAAETTLKRALELSPENLEVLAPLTVAYARLGQLEEARTTLQEYTDFWILYAPRIETHMDWWPFKREADIRRFGGGLIKAGLCCEDQLEAYIGRVRQGGTLD
jgi:TolB-like protein/class 3 adenylate cyclase/Flp pilus assembly protein TadD